MTVVDIVNVQYRMGYVYKKCSLSEALCSMPSWLASTEEVLEACRIALRAEDGEVRQ
jgi:hypothetical protein